MKLSVSFFLGVLCTLAAIIVYDNILFHPVSPKGEGSAELKRPLQQYELMVLRQRTPQSSSLTLEKTISEQETFTSYACSFTTQGKKVSCLINIPKGEGPFPVIVQFRGYVDREIYTTGEGTKRSGAVYAANGFITIAPDFLGYGESDMPSNVILEERFQTYTTALDLLASIPTLSQADSSRIGIWGHSNGGHIALTVLAITGKAYPTVLWAAVSKPFPYSILYFTDELSDNGKYLRGELARFEGLYNVDNFTFRSYLQEIKASLLLHQGTGDTAVPVSWSDEFVQTAKKNNVVIQYHRYPGADHNMSGSWNTVVQRDIEFFKEKLEKF